MGLGVVEADVALTQLLGAQLGGQGVVVGEGLAEDDASPPTLEGDVALHAQRTPCA
jgi:hypothetical protein